MRVARGGKGLFHVSDTDQIRALRAYYLHDNDGEPSIYHIWERGSGRGDVTTRVRVNFVGSHDHLRGVPGQAVRV